MENKIQYRLIKKFGPSIFHVKIPEDIIIKLNNKVKFEKGIFFTVFLIRLIRTNVMIINGITVTSRSMILKILAEFPSNILFV